MHAKVGLVNELVGDEPSALEDAARVLALDMLALSARGLQLGKEQLQATAEGGSLRAALTAGVTWAAGGVGVPKPPRACCAWAS